MQTIGFIGLGKMGGNMAARYLAAGYTVYGEARNRDGAQSLIDQGLRYTSPRVRATLAPKSLQVLDTEALPGAADGEEVSLHGCASMYVLLTGVADSMPGLPTAPTDDASPPGADRHGGQPC